MKVMVTGGAGFIGSNLADALHQAGHEVIVVDNLSTGRERNLNPGCRFYNIDITDPQVTEIVTKEQPDIISHHAAQIDVRLSVADPRFDASVNVLGMINLLEGAVKCGNFKRFIFASSGGVVYGEPQVLPVPETEPFNPMSPYGASKVAGEIYLRLYGNLYGIPWVALRYGNVYGPRQDPLGEAGVAAIFTLEMINDGETKIFGDGEQTRDFIFVNDVVRANLAALEKGEGEVFNIGTGKGSSVNEVFEVLREATGYGKKPVFYPPRKGELQHLSLEVGKARAGLGWEAEMSLEEGVGLTVESIRREQEEAGVAG